MPACAIRWCTKSSKTSNIQRDGITFHLFPRDLLQRQKWAEVCNRSKDWVPTYSSSICSRHFDYSQFKCTPNNRRVLIKTAVPNLLLQKYELDIANIRGKSANAITTRMLPNQSQPTTSDEDIHETWELQYEDTFAPATSKSDTEDLKLDTKPFEYLQTYIKELMPDANDDNAIFVIIVNGENTKADLEQSAEVNQSETRNNDSHIEDIKNEYTEDTLQVPNVENYLRRKVAQQTKLADESRKKIRALSQARQRLLRRNATLTKIIVQLKTQNIVGQLKGDPFSLNAALNNKESDSERYSVSGEDDEEDENGQQVM